MRANRMPRAIERAWLLKGVTETGSAPQVPQDIDEFIFPSPLFHPFVISLTPPFSPPPPSCSSPHSFLSHRLEKFPNIHSFQTSLHSTPFVDRSLRIYHVHRTHRSRFAFSNSIPVEAGRRRKGKKGEKEKEREREREGIMGTGSVCREMIWPERACN